MKIINSIDFDFGAVDYDYDSYTDCYTRGCDGICRCRTIENIQIKSINLDNLKDDILFSMCKNHKKFGDFKERERQVNEFIANNPLMEYGIHKLLIINQAHNKDLYQVNKTGGYYGEEIDGVDFENNKELLSDLNLFINLKSINGRMEFLLLKEYGFIPDQFKNMNWTTTMVSLNSISASPETQLNTLKQDLSYLPEDVMTIADSKKQTPQVNFLFENMVLKQDKGSFYKLIDGYHRYVKLKQNNADSDLNIKCIIGNKKPGFY